MKNQFRLAIKSIHPAVIIAALLLAALPASPALANGCLPVDVASQTELVDAINCYNTETSPSVYIIDVTGNISLMPGYLPIISNSTSGVELLINGNGFTLEREGGTMGSTQFPIISVDAGTTITIQDITITHGHNYTLGGGIHNQGRLTISNSILTENIASHAVNNPPGAGGAIFNFSTGILTINNSTLSNNTAAYGGGAIWNAGNITITNSTFSGNSAPRGGVIYNYNGASLSVTNSTFSGNSSEALSSGIHNDNDATLTVTNSTFTNNTVTGILSTVAGGIYNEGTLAVNNSILANTTAGKADCVNTGTISGAHNLIELDNSMGNACGTTAPIQVDPSLGTLADNSGSTKTHALLLDSPAIDAGTNTGCPANDQRGLSRPQNITCDIGAFELDVTAPTVDSFTAPTSATSLNVSITAFTASDDFALGGYKITESSTPPSPSAGDWAASPPTTYTVASLGSYTLYPWAKDTAGNVSLVYGSGVSVNITCLNPITVTSDADSGAGTLRQALTDACVGDLNNITMIDFDSALSGGTIHLGSELTIAKNVTIDGSALASKITISGDSDNNGTGDVRVFSITGGSPGLTVTLESLIVTKGVTSGHGAGLFMEQGMHVTIKNSTFSDNHAGGRGGGIGNQGGLTLINSTVSGNSAASADGGGGISNESGLTMTNSTISDNHATGAGASGGGLFNTGGATITNSTIFGNSTTTYGGGISTTANLTITNSTIAGNSAGVVGGLLVEGNVTHLRNTIIANNSSTTLNSFSHNDCTDTSDYPNPPSADGDGIMTNVNNLIENNNCSPSLSSDPLLGPLTNNGGPTQTMALLAGSDAIDAGDDTICAGTYHPGTNPNPVNSLDQRGITRPNSAHCDIGAYEYEDASAPSVTTFTVTSPTNSLNIPITTFTASDDATVAAYLITETSTAPLAGAAGWTASAPTIYTVGSAGSYTLYPWVKDAVDNVSAVYGSPASITVEITAPTVNSVTRTGPNPTSAASVNFTVTFSESVTGVNISDFSLTLGSITGASVTSVSGGPTSYTVTVKTGSGVGTLRLNVLDNNSIKDLAGNSLEGVFNNGETYTINKRLTFNSTGTQDGWILESSETSSNGGTMNSSATLLYLGDNATKNQYRSILSFNTSSLPNNAVITKVTLKLKQQGITGRGNPVTMFQGFVIDIKKGMFGTASLALTDFNATPNKTVGPQSPALVSGWYSLNLTSGKDFINKLSNNGGLTQIRLRFKLDDNNNNNLANFLKLYSGNAAASNRPQLIIDYYVP